MLILLYELNGTQGQTKVNLPNEREEANENKSRNLEIHSSLYRVSKGKEEETQLCVFTDVIGYHQLYGQYQAERFFHEEEVCPFQENFFLTRMQGARVEKKLM